jgi:hypothetical protein
MIKAAAVLPLGVVNFDTEIKRKFKRRFLEGYKLFKVSISSFRPPEVYSTYSCR